MLSLADTLGHKDGARVGQTGVPRGGADHKVVYVLVGTREKHESLGAPA
jgi:hypothetical protein